MSNRLVGPNAAGKNQLGISQKINQSFNKQSKLCAHDFPRTYEFSRISSWWYAFRHHRNEIRYLK